MRSLSSGIILVTVLVGCDGRGSPGSGQQPTESQRDSQGTESQLKPEDLPLLRFTRMDGADALLGYKLTAAEQKLFKEMDSTTAKLAEDAPLDAYHDAAAQIGGKYGLTRRQSIAFWTRATFSTFEP
jgi:hypothetical protein